jgi:histidine triad (HIT) family protein
MSDCPFCGRIGRGEYDHEDRYNVAFEPLNPVTPGHLLVVTKAHTASARTSPTFAGRAVHFAAALADRLELDDFNLITSAGAAATQSVPHLHVHVVPRLEGDGLALPWTGQREKVPAVKLLEEALFLRMNGEYAPGGNENWHDWDLRAEVFLRGLLPPGAEEPAPGDRD